MADHQKVSVDTVRMKAYGGWLMSKWSEIDLLTGHVKEMKITPGFMTGSAELRQRFNDQRQALETIITNLAGMLYQTGLDITHLAGNYLTTEDLQKDDVIRLKDTIDSISKYYPGANNVLPPEDPKIPDPSK